MNISNITRLSLAVLLILSGCATLDSQTSWQRERQPVQSVREIADSDKLTVQARFEPSDTARVMFSLSTVRQCTRTTTTTVHSMPTTVSTLSSGWVPWTEVVIGTLLLGAGAGIYFDADKDRSGIWNNSGSPLTGDRGKYGAYSIGGIGALLNAFAVGNWARAGTDVGPVEVTTEIGDEQEECGINSLSGTPVHITNGSDEIYRGLLKQNRTDENNPAYYPLVVAATAAELQKFSVATRFVVTLGTGAKAIAAEVAAGDIGGLLAAGVAAGDAQAAQEKAIRREAARQAWSQIIVAPTGDAVQGFIDVHGEFADEVGAKELVGRLAIVDGVVLRLDAALADPVADPARLMTAMQQADNLGASTRTMRDRVRQAACRIGQDGAGEQQAFEFAFRKLRALNTADDWPCSVTQTNAIWKTFKVYFDEQVEVRGDFAGGADYLHRWHNVLRKFELVTAGLRAKKANKALTTMSRRVGKAIERLPKEVRCEGGGAAQRSCTWTCANKHDRNSCAQARPLALQRCQERAASQAETCMACCMDGGKGCRRKSPLVCGTTKIP